MGNLLKAFTQRAQCESVASLHTNELHVCTCESVWVLIATHAVILRDSFSPSVEQFLVFN